jgi:hypothetical protein
VENQQKFPLSGKCGENRRSKGEKRALKEMAGCLPSERMAGKGRKSSMVDTRECEKAKGRKVGREVITMEELKLWKRVATNCNVPGTQAGKETC